jgi:predicted nucleotidyltransferase
MRSMSTIRQKPPTLDELRSRRGEILSVAHRHGASNVRVFGSVARGEEGANDVDLLVELEDGRSLLDLAELHVELEDLLACRVDVAEQVKPRLREIVEAEAVPL